MKQAIFELEGVSPYGQNGFIREKRKDQETAQDFEARTWKERLHVASNGNVTIPAMAIKNCLTAAAKFVGQKISGKGNSTFAKRFTAGLLCTDDVDLGVKAEDVPGEWLFVPSDGVAGSGKRVEKCFPRIDPPWGGKVTVMILDDLITEKVFEFHLERAGQFIGLGRFRPERSGSYGRFTFKNLKVVDV